MKLFKYLLLSCLLGLAGMTSGASAELRLDRDYRLVTPAQPVETGDKIEVIEFFYYGCPHCFEIEPYLKRWKASMPKDVAYRLVPALFRDSWVPLTKTFYALEALGELARLHDAVFEAIHVKNINLNNEQILFDWVEKQGVDRKKFADAYASFAVRNRVVNARNLTVAYGVDGTPSLVVDGKYITGPGLTGSHESAIKVLNELIAKAREERSRR
ncbi:MAG: thiol:disulfide interchange protein DsbA/DsbL [Burkholderiales bacterium]